MAKLAGAAGGASGAGAAGGFSAGAGASGALGTSAFGAGAGEGAAGAAGLAGAPSTFVAGGGSTLGALGSFASDILSPSTGLAGQQVGQQLAAGGTPHLGDLATYIVQQLVNQQAQSAVGPAFRPLANLMVRKLPPPGPAKIHPQGD